VRLLLDTHALLWWLSDDPALGPEARTLVADPANDICISVASLWEIVVKMRVGKLEADIEAIESEVDKQAFTRLAIEPAHLVELAALPVHHRDPFDHLLIAQARAEGLSLLSQDRRFQDYEVPLIRCEAD
jgi:PIN domain nuclease of toxin-antitoxin system